MENVKTVGQFFRGIGKPEPDIASRSRLAEKYGICPAAWYVDSPEQNQMLLRELLNRYEAGERDFAA